MELCLVVRVTWCGLSWEVVSVNRGGRLLSLPVKIVDTQQQRKLTVGSSGLVTTKSLRFCWLFFVCVFPD